MDEHILKRLTSRELKRTILQKAKDILEERERNSNERNKDGKGNATTENEQCCNKNPEGEAGGGSHVDGDTPPDKEDNSFYTLCDFSCKYLKMCQMNKLNHANVEYELVNSFMRTFNSELKFQLNLTSADDQEDKKNSMLHQMADLFTDKLICYCTTPMALVVPHGDSEGGLLGDDLLEQIRFFFKQIEEKSQENFLFNMCLDKIAECIFNFKPNPEDVASWISRQALADLVKALLGDNLKRYEQCNHTQVDKHATKCVHAWECIICMTDFIKERHAKLNFAQVDNVVLMIEIVQYAIVYLSERKYNTKCSSFVREEWFEHFTDLLHTLKNSEWKIFFHQLIVAETFLYEKKAENTNKEFNSYYKQQLEVWRLKNTSYSKWFKIEMPLSLSLLK